MGLRASVAGSGDGLSFALGFAHMGAVVGGSGGSETALAYGLA